MAVLVEMIVNRSVSGSELLQALDVPEPGHRAFSSPERLVGILGPIVKSTPTLLTFQISEHFHRRAI